MKIFGSVRGFDVLLPVLGLFFFMLLIGYRASAHDRIAQQADTGQQEDIQVPPPPFTEGIFPCSDCHGEMEVNLERRELEEFHDDIVLDHGEKSRWCFDCHDAQNRDRLHLASGEPVDFKESYRLCGQCHGPKLRDWKAGIHGRRTGYWNGRKEYLLCANCHNPHAPEFEKMKPEPAPRKPGKGK